MSKILLFTLVILIATCTCSDGQEVTAPPLTLSPRDTLLTDCAERIVVQAVHLSGNRRTKASVILREMSVSPGQSVCRDSLQYLLHENYLRLYNLNLFTDIRVSTQDSGEGAVNIEVALKEQWFLIPQADVQLADRNFNVWWKEQHHDLGRINLGLYLVHKNVSGNLDRLSVSTHVGYTQQLTVSYLRPYIDHKQKQGLGFAAGYSRSREIAYTTAGNKLLFARNNNDFLYANFFISASWIYRQAYRSRHILGLSYNDYKVGDTVRLLRPDFFARNAQSLQFAELNYRFEYNGTDNWNYPRRGVKIVGWTAFRKGFSGMGVQSITGLELGFFKKLCNRWYSSAVFRGRSTFTDQPAYFFQSALGYKTNVVRGYEYYVIQADHFALGRFSLKYEAVRRQFHRLPFRYLPELPLWIYPKIFADVGYGVNGKDRYGNNLSNMLLYSVGIGLDIITAYDLKLRIEFALNHLGENGIYLHANSE